MQGLTGPPSLPPPGSADLIASAATPLTEIRDGVWLKLDQTLPTGSFKSRGAAAMLALAAGIGVERVVVDSSGNAGKAAAAYASDYGIAADVYVPDRTDPDKIEAMRQAGATVFTVPGPREAAALAAQDAAGRDGGGSGGSGSWYASHVYQPIFHHGVKSLAYELVAQLGERISEGEVIVPVGNGTLVLGLWLGFRELQADRTLAKLPGLIAVQAERSAPLAGMRVLGSTVAAGIAVGRPARSGQVRAALLACGGRVETVSEEEIFAAAGDLERQGVEVEPTSATVWAYWTSSRRAAHDPRHVRPVDARPVVLVLTGR
jgi:threonine synthase